MNTTDIQGLLNFEPQTTRKNDPETSKQAFRKLDLSKIRKAILAKLKQYPAGLATFQIARELRVPRDYVSPHMKVLMRMDYVYKTGRTVINRATKSKATSEVWALKGELSISEAELEQAVRHISSNPVIEALLETIRGISKKVLDDRLEIDLKELIRKYNE